MQDPDAMNEDLLALIEAWRNEKCGPVLMTIDEELLRRILEQVENQERNVELQWEAAEDAYRNKTAEVDDTRQIMLRLQQVEIERIRFVLRAYLRTRIKKIEECVQYYLRDEHQSIMTENELAYAKRFSEMVEKHFHNSVLNDIPETLRALDTKTEEIDMVPVPKENAHVFIRVKEEIGDYIVDPANEEDTTIPLEKDNVLMIAYSSVRPLVKSHKVELI